MKHDFKALGQAVDSSNTTLSLALYYAEILKRDVLDFGDAMHDSHLSGIVKFLDENRICEITVSSSWSGTLNALIFFLNHGWKVVGTAKVESGTFSYKPGDDGEYVRVKDTVEALRLVKE